MYPGIYTKVPVCMMYTCSVFYLVTETISYHLIWTYFQIPLVIQLRIGY